MRYFLRDIGRVVTSAEEGLRFAVTVALSSPLPGSEVECGAFRRPGVFDEPGLPRLCKPHRTETPEERERWLHHCGCLRQEAKREFRLRLWRELGCMLERRFSSWTETELIPVGNGHPSAGNGGRGRCYSTWGLGAAAVTAPRDRLGQAAATYKIAQRL